MQVLITQPYVPSYRVPLFNALSAQLARSGSTLSVVAGTPSGTQKERSDAESDHPWLTTVESKEKHSPVGAIKHRKIPSSMMASADIIVSELDVGNLNGWHALTTRRGTRRVVLWGHGKAYTTREREASARLRSCMARMADHVWTYAPGGRDALIQRGVEPRHVTSIGNATDTRALAAAIAERSRRPTGILESFGGQAVVGRHVAAFVGGLDADKRIDFLLAAADHAKALDPGFLLVVAGSGAYSARVAERAGANLLFVPRAGVEQWADLAVNARSIWMPGRIGLVAVDALTARLPLCTTNFPYHAPEFEFLSEGSTVYTLPDEPAHFAQSALNLNCRMNAPFPVPSIDDVVMNMSESLAQLVKD